MDLGLKGKKVIMNGGAHGIGLEILKLLTAEGADVAFFSRDQGRIDSGLGVGRRIGHDRPRREKMGGC